MSARLSGVKGCYCSSLPSSTCDFCSGTRKYSDYDKIPGDRTATGSKFLTEWGNGNSAAALVHEASSRLWQAGFRLRFEHRDHSNEQNEAIELELMQLAESVTNLAAKLRSSCVCGRVRCAVCMNSEVCCDCLTD
jgi:hypothetical protein